MSNKKLKLELLSTKIVDLFFLYPAVSKTSFCRTQCQEMRDEYILEQLVVCELLHTNGNFFFTYAYWDYCSSVTHPSYWNWEALELKMFEIKHIRILPDFSRGHIMCRAISEKQFLRSLDDSYLELHAHYTTSIIRFIWQTSYMPTYYVMNVLRPLRRRWWVTHFVLPLSPTAIVVGRN